MSFYLISLSSLDLTALNEQILSQIDLNRKVCPI
uniref:Uncharacterized protein n=1 Tax=Amphimedon queenslandica TaxID=400682 RepID=A0A1X7V2B7_AMPQE